MSFKKTALLTAGVARATKVITDDTIGDYLIHQPINRRVNQHLQNLAAQSPDGVVQEPAWLKYLDGLRCPWCIGFWVGVGALAAERATRDHPTARAVGKFTAEALTMNLLAAPVVANLSGGDE